MKDCEREFNPLNQYAWVISLNESSNKHDNEDLSRLSELAGENNYGPGSLFFPKMNSLPCCGFRVSLVLNPSRSLPQPFGRWAARDYKNLFSTADYVPFSFPRDADWLSEEGTE